MSRVMARLEMQRNGSILLEPVSKEHRAAFPGGFVIVDREQVTRIIKKKTLVRLFDGGVGRIITTINKTSLKALSP